MNPISKDAFRPIAQAWPLTDNGKPSRGIQKARQPQRQSTETLHVTHLAALQTVAKSTGLSLRRAPSPARMSALLWRYVWLHFYYV